MIQSFILVKAVPSALYVMCISCYVYPTFYWAFDYLSMLGLKLIHVSDWAPDLYSSQQLTILPK